MQSELFIRSVSIDWNELNRNSYLLKIPAFRHFHSLTFQKNITFFCGENGTGKSTLLEGMAVAYGFNPEGGTQNYHFSTYDDVSELQEAIRMVKGIRKRNSGYFFRAESFFNVATAATLNYEDRHDYHAESHGESFLYFLQKECREGIYFMDEPEAALSPQRQLTLISHLHLMAMEGSQFIIATHSPLLLGMPEAQILCFDETGIHEIAWEDTESYRITKLFLDNRNRLLDMIYAPDVDAESN